MTSMILFHIEYEKNFLYIIHDHYVYVTHSMITTKYHIGFVEPIHMVLLKNCIELLFSHNILLQIQILFNIKTYDFQKIKNINSN